MASQEVANATKSTTKPRVQANSKRDQKTQDEEPPAKRQRTGKKQLNNDDEEEGDITGKVDGYSPSNVGTITLTEKRPRQSSNASEIQPPKKVKASHETGVGSIYQMSKVAKGLNGEVKKELDAVWKDKTFYASPDFNTPMERRRDISWQEREKLNLEQRGLDEVHYAKTEVDSYIFFYAHSERYGGPFGFMSNFYPSKFRVNEIHKEHVFDSVEQFYQYCKAIAMDAAPEKFIEVDDISLSSSDLKHRILTIIDNPNMCAENGRLFNRFEIDDPKWWHCWNQFWTSMIPEILEKGIRAKFEQNPDLAQLLMMTGNFHLVEASKRDDSCGIGFHAADAMKNRGSWGRNLLGETLMEVRAALRKSAPGTLPGYDFDFWRTWEEMLNEDRYSRPSKRLAMLEHTLELPMRIFKPLLVDHMRAWPKVGDQLAEGLEDAEVAGWGFEVDMKQYSETRACHPSALRKSTMREVYDGKYAGSHGHSKADRFANVVRKFKSEDKSKRLKLDERKEYFKIKEEYSKDQGTQKEIIKPSLTLQQLENLTF